MIKDIVKLETFEFEQSIMQQITFLWLFTVGVIYSSRDGEHYTILLKIGIIQYELTMRIWRIF
jgi:hypothetical protein